MRGRKRVFFLILIMTTISFIAIGIAISLLYRTAVWEQRARLVETAQSQARLIEAVARFDAVYSKDYFEGAERATLSQIIDAHANYKGFGETGEFTLARRVDDEIIFLLSHRHYDLDYPKPVPFDSGLAEPMRRALSGQSGTVISSDYRGEKVLAAYEPVAELNLGIVAKIDLTEVRVPFIRAGLIALGSAVLAILLGALLFFRVTNPMIKSLAESEEKLSRFIGSATEGFVLYNSELNLIEINEKALEIFPAETTKEDVIGRNILEISPGLEKTGRYDKYCEVIKTGKPLYFDDLVLVPKFGDRYLFVRAFRVAEGLGLIFTDITERKQAEEKLKEYSEKLEEMVEERTKELQDAQEELIRREKLAVLGQLAGGVGHELRNPLGAIKNAAYFLNMALEKPEPEVKETLEFLEKEIATSERIISSLLNFARPELPTRRKVEINNIVQDALSHVVVPESVKVESHLDKELPTVLADPDQFTQVFSNIVLNAIQAMPEGGQLIIKSKLESPKLISVSFTDTGEGIPEEKLGKLFEPLFTTKAKGIGLGLALTRTHVEGHGGTIEVESEVGKGSTFTVRLPIEGKERD